MHLDLFGISLIDTDPAPLRAFLWILEHLLASRGVDASRHIVVYDEKSGMRAARAFWALEYFGHEHTRLLDGGFGAWQAGGHPISTEPVAPASTSWTGAAGRRSHRHATATSWIGSTPVMPSSSTRAPTVSTSARPCVRRAAAASRARCTSSGRRTCVPTARSRAPTNCAPCTNAAGVTPDKEVLTYCQGGYRAAHGYLALRLLGYPRVRNYVGSWKEWGDRLELPMQSMPNA